MVEEPDELPRGQGQRGIGGAGDPLVPRQMGDLDPRVVPGQPIQERAHVRERWMPSSARQSSHLS